MPARSLALPPAHPPHPRSFACPPVRSRAPRPRSPGWRSRCRCAGAATTAPQAAVAPESVLNSSLDAPLFYQLMIGELELRQGEPGAAYEVVLDAARRTKDAQLFRRATDIALRRAPASRR